MINELINSNAHILVAGATGSGKSVIINKFIKESGSKFDLFLIDPKRVELFEYRKNGNVLFYADNTRKYIKALSWAEEILSMRLKIMQFQRVKTWVGKPIYIVIDEFADLIHTSKDFANWIIKIAQLGRAAKVFLLLATQRATANVINGSIKVNCDYRIALHVPTAQDSRNIIGQSGAEKLPRYGKALLYSPDGLKEYEIRL